MQKSSQAKKAVVSNTAKSKQASEKETKKKKCNKFVKEVRKRNGAIAEFDLSRITNAIYKAMIASGEGSFEEAEMVSNKVLAELIRIIKRYSNFLPTVEGIQDAVEKELILNDYVRTSKNYIIYREKRATVRKEHGEVPKELRELVEKSRSYFRDPLGEFVYYRTYSRWIDEEQRRETWVETVDRYMSFMKENLGNKFSEKEYKELEKAILNHEVMPSMRLVQFSGKPARRCNVCAYNCSYIAPSKLKDFGEIIYLSMSGTGVGYSVESRNIQQLPIIKPQNGHKKRKLIVPDSKEGWAEALVLGMKTWYDGKDIEFDYSKLRPAGARLKTMGGKSSGPEPLRQLLDFTRNKIFENQGKRLSNLDSHDIICQIGVCVVSGGVRRSAMISLSDIGDKEMRDAKKGQFYLNHPQRSIANNSAVYEEKPSSQIFLDEWRALVKSGSGERGLFNRGGLEKVLPERRVKYLKEKYERVSTKGLLGDLGSNPCGEIILQSKQFCNLTEVISRVDDTPASLSRKMRLAVMLGTYQATLTNFGYLSKEWKKNCEEERLLGVSVSGQWDAPVVRDAKVLEKLKKEAIKYNETYAKKLGITPAKAVTCVKPSGTVSQTVDCASGMHPRFAPYYIRRVRISTTDSLFKMLKDQGVPYHPEVGQTLEDANTMVLEFPTKAPENSVFKDDVSAIDMLEHWKMVKESYTEHNPSMTVYVGDDEWIEVANWVYKNWEKVGGLTFLPRTNHVYRLAPYEEITKEKYEELKKRFEGVDYSKIVTYEKKDETEQKREAACAGGACEFD